MSVASADDVSCRTCRPGVRQQGAALAHLLCFVGNMINVDAIEVDFDIILCVLHESDSILVDGILLGVFRYRYMLFVRRDL